MHSNNLQYASSILYNISVVVPSEVAAAGGLYQVMTSLAPAIGNVFATILITNQMNKGLPTDRENTAEAYRRMSASRLADKP